MVTYYVFQAVVVLLAGVATAARLDNTYLPPAGAAYSGGTGGSGGIATPFGGAGGAGGYGGAGGASGQGILNCGLKATK